MLLPLVAPCETEYRRVGGDSVVYSFVDEFRYLPGDRPSPSTRSINRMVLNGYTTVPVGRHYFAHTFYITRP